MALLQIDNLSKNFDGVKAVDDLSLAVEEGRITALIGPNGSGKTTLFNLISGFLRPASGRILLDGREISRLSPHKIAIRGIGRTFQTIRLFPKMTVLDNIMLGLCGEAEEGLLPALLKGGKVKFAEDANLDKALSVLHTVGLEHKKDEYAENLSFGQRRLVEIARTYAMNTRLLLLDEPFSGIYPEMFAKIFAIMHHQKRAGQTVFFIEHNMQVVRQMADKVIVLDHGRKLAEGTPEEVFNHDGVHEAYFGRRRYAS